MSKRNQKRPQKRTRFSMGGSASFTAKKALFKANMALDLLNPEFKAIDSDATFAQGSTFGFRLLNGLVKGTDIDDRVGNSVKIKSLDFRVLVTRNTASTTNNYVRLMLVLDKNPNGLAATAAMLLTDPVGSPILSPRNLSSRNRFVILRDMIVEVGNAGNKPSEHKQVYKKLNMHVTFNTSNVGTIADITENALYLVSVSDSGVNTPQITYYSRVRYLDN